MPNDYFQFKQFLIKQDKCAMKVCTDTCLFGAWVAEKVSCFQLPVSNCLDIGAGTGLLSLMLAQKSNDAVIDAIEIDKAAALQASENFKLSSWKERLHAYHDSIQHFSKSINKNYDVIICNPPFYEQDLTSHNKQRNLALHSKALLLKELISVVQKLLADDGNFFVLLPYHRTKAFEELLFNNDLYAEEKILIKQTSNHDYFRTIFWIKKNAATFYQTAIIIKAEQNNYSNEFVNLLKDFYLNL